VSALFVRIDEDGKR